MPNTIVPEAQEIRALASSLLAQPRTARQTTYNLPKHFPCLQTEALLFAVVEFTRLAERQAAELASYKASETAANAGFMAEILAYEQEEEARLFMETCAVEHLFFPAILAG